jgi:integrase/recombinase XerD
MWEAYLKGFKAYLQLERSMSDNTVDAYIHDTELLGVFMQEQYAGIKMQDIERKHLQEFIVRINEFEFTEVHRQEC